MVAGFPSNPQFSWHYGAALVVALVIAVWRMHQSRRNAQRELDASIGVVMEQRIKLADERAMKSANTNLVRAARENDVAMALRSLQVGSSPDTVDPETNTPVLYIAAQQGSADVVRELVDANADINVANRNNITPLVAAINCSDNNSACRDCAEVLLKRGGTRTKPVNGDDALDPIDVNIASNVSGDTALLAACRLGDKELIRQIVLLGANKEHSNTNDQTPMSILEATGNSDLVDVLNTTFALDAGLVAPGAGAAQELEGLRQRHA